MVAIIQKNKMENEILELMKSGGPWAVLVVFITWVFLVPGFKNMMNKNNKLTEANLKAAEENRKEMAEMRQEMATLRAENIMLKKTLTEYKEREAEKDKTIFRLQERVKQLEEKE